MNKQRASLLRAFQLVCCVWFVSLCTPVASLQGQEPQAEHRFYLPRLQTPRVVQPFGFDIRVWYPQTMDLAVNAMPRWSRIGHTLWNELEPERGAGYRWEVLAPVEDVITRLRESQIEPIVIVQNTPPWAAQYPAHLCSPMRREYIADFARLMEELARRYSSGPLQVNFWEIGNEPDLTRSESPQYSGIGCWADDSLPDAGGGYYAEMLRAVYPAIKRGNPNAQVIAGALAYPLELEDRSQRFLEGLISGGRGSFDILSFHAYGDWANGDVVQKTLRIRAVLQRYGMAGFPLMATELGAVCWSNCNQDFYTFQANYAARVYAQAQALGLYGALWYTLADRSPGFQESHMIDVGSQGEVRPRKAYFAFRNSALRLGNLRYIGPPLTEPRPQDAGTVQVLAFERSNSYLYVLFVPHTDRPLIYNLPVARGAQAICTDRLDRSDAEGGPVTYYCSDQNGDGLIPRAVYELPQYVEVFK